MKFGILIPATVESGDYGTIAKRVEDLGYESSGSVSTRSTRCSTSHFRARQDGTLPLHYRRWIDTFVAPTMAAASTTDLRLGTAVCLLAERDTLLTSHIVASPDFYSNGRFEFGVGAGWLREATEAMATASTSRLTWPVFASSR